MSTTLTYRTTNGRDEKVNLSKTSSTIDFSLKKIESIDLTPLRSFTNLEHLSLHGNNLRNIDLAPLESCKALIVLDLSRNQLETLDLFPLRFCHNMKTLNITGNKYNNVDFAPLFWTYNLAIFWDRPSGNSWLDLDFANILYDRPSGNYEWSFLFKIARHYKRGYRIQHEILHAMGLGNYGFIDCDLFEHFLAIPPGTPTPKAREQIVDVLVEKIVSSIDEGGTTTGLNVGKIVEEHSEIAVRLQKINMTRRAEIEAIEIRTSDDPKY